MKRRYVSPLCNCKDYKNDYNVFENIQKEDKMKRGIFLLLLLGCVAFFMGCAMYANHSYGLSMHHDIEIRSGSAINEIFERFGPPDMIHETKENTYYVFKGQSAITVMGIISRIQTEAVVVVTDENDRVSNSYFVTTGEGNTYLGPADLYFTIHP